MMSIMGTGPSLYDYKTRSDDTSFSNTLQGQTPVIH